MTFPVVAAANTSTQGSATTTHGILLPEDVESGDLLVAAIAVSEADVTFSWPAGWTELADTSADESGHDVGFSAAYRVADGSEGSTVTVTSSDSLRSAHQTWRIAGAMGPPEIAVATGGTNTGLASPPALSPSWGAADTLWLAMLAMSAPRSHSGYPSNYTNGVNTETGTTSSHVALRTAQRELNAASEDPGNFSFAASISTAWVTATVAIRPALAGVTTVDGTSAATGIGTVSARVDAAVALMGAGATVVAGAPSVERGALAAVTGVLGSGAVGSLLPAHGASLVLQGLGATAAAGDATAHGSLSVVPSSAALNGQLGSAAAGIVAAAGVTGQAATGLIGLSAFGISSVARAAGVAATAAPGGVGLLTDDVPEVSGVAAAGGLGSVAVPISADVAAAGLFSVTHAGSITAILATEIVGSAAAGQVGLPDTVVDGHALPGVVGLGVALGKIRVLRSGWSPAGAVATAWLPAAVPDTAWADLPDADRIWVSAAAAANDWQPRPVAGQEWGT